MPRRASARMLSSGVAVAVALGGCGHHVGTAAPSRSVRPCPTCRTAGGTTGRALATLRDLDISYTSGNDGEALVDIATLRREVRAILAAEPSPGRARALRRRFNALAGALDVGVPPAHLTRDANALAAALVPTRRRR